MWFTLCDLNCLLEPNKLLQKLTLYGILYVNDILRVFLFLKDS